MMRARRGFTLIEVLVAIAILGVGLTAILAAQAGTFTALSHARNLSQSTGLLRCKMSEVEDDLRTAGFAQNDVVEGSGPCCDQATQFRMTCAWRVERPTFPDPKLGVGDINANLDLSGGSTPGQSGAGSLVNAMHGGMELPQNGNLGDMAQAITQGGGNISDTITTMFMGIAYPEMQQVFENGTRKISVTITWNEGKVPFSSDLVEWYTDARASGVTAEIPTADPADSSTPAPTSTSKSTGSGSTPKPASTVKK